MDTENRDELIAKYRPKVEWVAMELKRKVPKSVELDDLVQAGMIGLMDAAGRYREEDGNRFWTFAYHRVKGQMLDLLRSMDYAGRTIRDLKNKADEARRVFFQKYGRRATEEEISELLGFTVEQWRKKRFNFLYMAELTDSPKRVGPHEFVEREFRDRKPLPNQIMEAEEVVTILSAALAKLPARHRQVIIEYFYQGRTLKETGDAINVVESRASQIKNAALGKLREQLESRGLTLEMLLEQ